MSKPKIRVNDGVLYYIEKKDCSVMEFGVVRKVNTYKRYRTEYIVETTDGHFIKAWRNQLKKSYKGSSESIPKAQYDMIKAEVEEMEKRLEADASPVAVK
jgi:CRISPR/Cas system endoribonuclease Cas6 (RAMP superfamily)